MAYLQKSHPNIPFNLSSINHFYSSSFNILYIFNLAIAVIAVIAATSLILIIVASYNTNEFHTLRIIPNLSTNTKIFQSELSSLMMSKASSLFAK